MNKFLDLSDSQRKNVYESFEHKAGLTAQVIEKDFWVTAILQAVFTQSIVKHIVFKCGRSISKDWKLICRFSKDIDISVEPVLPGVPEADLTKKANLEINKRNIALYFRRN